MPNLEFPPVAETPAFPATSLGARLTNVFVSPGEVFDEVKNSPPQPANWVVPMICNMIIGIIFTMVLFSQPAIVQQVRQPQEERLQKMVKEGKLTQKMADQQMAIMDRFMTPSFFKATGIVSVFLLQTPMLFLFAMALWLIAKFVFHAPLEYMKAVEAAGLASMIAVLNKAVTLPLAVIYGNMYKNPGPVLLLSHFDASNLLHITISSFNLIWLWNLTVLAVALARLSSTRFIKAAVWPFGFWLLWLGFSLAMMKVAAMVGGK